MVELSSRCIIVKPDDKEEEVHSNEDLYFTVTPQLSVEASRSDEEEQQQRQDFSMKQHQVNCEKH